MADGMNITKFGSPMRKREEARDDSLQLFEGSVRLSSVVFLFFRGLQRRRASERNLPKTRLDRGIQVKENEKMLRTQKINFFFFFSRCLSELVFRRHPMTWLGLASLCTDRRERDQEGEGENKHADRFLDSSVLVYVHLVMLVMLRRHSFSLFAVDTVLFV